ncbi:MAG TPA: D-alanyl-D-alanine carboxypeptidase [Desulfitobacterium dehalogenans]|uniref:D-alanyl-D-alanine carboxypeptidase n=1 Tax=Desulfitobacterium dehalogenans TaxID=36854 RepID=A0A7C6Z329_9FIRM|nr:D-alanyl-D-alanine carboxypeptidase [Desulfitobacterium dehalogenans]
MSKKSKKRIPLTLLTIIITAIIVLTFFPGLLDRTGLAETLHTLSSSPSINKSDPVAKDAEKTSPNTSGTFLAQFSDTLEYTPPEDSSYLMLNLRTGERLLEKNGDTRRAPASTVKLLTGLLVHEKLQEDELITLGEEVKVEGSVLGLKPGDKILVKDLFTAMYVFSANDAASALAVAAYGTMDDFIQAMNRYALELGCADSQFKTANGMPAQDQYTTAKDLAIIASKFTENPTLMDYVKQKKASVNWTDANGWKQVREISNTNQLLGIYPGDQGLKTGTTTEAGQCLVTYITMGDGDLLLVLLGSEQRYTDTVELLDQGIAKIRTRAALKNILSSPEAFYNMPGFFAP